jgi:hypothetical protein
MILALAMGCNKPSQNKEAVERALLEHLRKNAQLDLSQMKVEVGAVNFRGNEATASVSFQPNASPGGGMQMNYTFENKNGQWVVKGRPSSGGSPHGVTTPPGGQVAPGDQVPPGQAPSGNAPHGGTPPQTGAQPQQPSDLPPGHPPIGSGKGAGQKQ